MKVTNNNGTMSVDTYDGGGVDEDYEIVDSKGARATKFRDEKQAMEFMRNPLYKKSEGFRREVKRLLDASTHIDFGGNSQPEQVQRQTAKQREDGMRIVHEQARALFADPRYRTSPSYRKYVEEFVREHGHLLDEYDPGAVRHHDGARNTVTIEGSQKVTGMLSPSQQAALNGEDE